LVLVVLGVFTIMKTQQGEVMRLLLELISQLLLVSVVVMAEAVAVALNAFLVVLVVEQVPP
jgi:hypothetical protein